MNAFDLDYLVDNGFDFGWTHAIEPGCKLYFDRADKDYYVQDASAKPLGWGETKEEAIASARYLLTERKRLADGIPAMFAERQEWRKMHPLAT